MPRNSSGVYSLPAGNPVITGTTITSTWANATMPDLGNEITNSLDRSGRGSMTGQLKSADGTQAAPGITFSAETSSGFFRSGAGTLGLSVLNTLVGTMTATGVAWALALGTAALPSLAFTSDPNTGIYSPGADQIGFATAGTSRITVGATGGVTVNAASSGTTFTVNGVLSGADTQRWTDGTTTAALFSATGLVAFGTTSAHALNLWAGNASRIAITSAGNVTINTPSSGTALTVNGVAGQVGVMAQAAGSTQFRVNDTANSILGIYAASSPSVIAGSFSNHAFELHSNSVQRIVLGTAGNVLINAPSSGIGLTAVMGGSGLFGFATTASAGQFAGINIAGNGNTPGSASFDLFQDASNNVRITNRANGFIEFDTNNTERLTITADGRIYGKALHNNAGSVTGTTNQYIASLTWVPTLTAVSNVTSSTAVSMFAIRVGNVVVAGGAIGVDHTTNGAVTQVGISLPVASNFAATSALAGVIVNASTGAPYMVGFINADATNDRAQATYIASTNASEDTHYCIFIYLIT